MLSLLRSSLGGAPRSLERSHPNASIPRHKLRIGRDLDSHISNMKSFGSSRWMGGVMLARRGVLREAEFTAQRFGRVIR